MAHFFKKSLNFPHQRWLAASLMKMSPRRFWTFEIGTKLNLSLYIKSNYLGNLIDFLSLSLSLSLSLTKPWCEKRFLHPIRLIELFEVLGASVSHLPTFNLIIGFRRKKNGWARLTNLRLGQCIKKLNNLWSYKTLFPSLIYKEILCHANRGIKAVWFDCVNIARNLSRQF